MPPRFILASASQVRAKLLEHAGVLFEIAPAQVDEDEIKRALVQEDAPAQEVAEVLAELKAQRISKQHPEALVLGADQILECEGRLFDKPKSLADARSHLTVLSGKTHTLVTALAVAQNGKVIWRHVSSPQLTMRDLSEDFKSQYLKANGERLLNSVGAYFLEEQGVQLFTKLDGDYFSVLGLSLLPLLDFLRRHDVVSI